VSRTLALCFRLGDETVRPATPFTGSAHRFLAALRTTGCASVPTPIGVDAGRERLVFIAGEVPLPPYPYWAQSDAALESVAQLMRQDS